ncbi:MAG: beta-galactosidase trimerization domain-containing protein [Bryobacteraceae bacterium]
MLAKWIGLRRTLLNREIATLGSAPRPVALLYSKTSMLQQLPDQSRETDSNPHLSALRQIYNDSQSAGVYMGITTEKKILAGDLQKHKILVLPSVEFLSDAVTNEILRWAEGGGTLVISPDSLVGDEYERHSQAARLLRSRTIRRKLPSPKRGESWSRFLSLVAKNAGRKPQLVVTRQDGGAAPEIEYRVTDFDEGRLAYFVNNSDQDVKIILRPDFSFTRIVDRRTEMPLPEPRLLLAARETAILQFR